MVGKLRINDLEWLQGDPEIIDQVSRLVDRYQGMFTTDTKRLGKTDWVEDFVIKTIPGTVPVKQWTRPLTPKQKEELKITLDNWQLDGVVKPSESPWASPLCLVTKKSGETRWTIDYRVLNNPTIADAFPTPNISQVLEGLVGSKVFCCLDASQAYHHLSVHPAYTEMTPFICNFGLLEFLRMPFGLKNVGANYCMLVQAVVDNLKDPGVAAYLDDILLHTKSVKEHLELLEKVFEAHFQAGIMINPKKTVLFAKAEDYHWLQGDWNWAHTY